MRLAVYTDFSYHRDSDGTLWADQAFGVFVAALAPLVDGLLLIGRLDPDPDSARHPLPGGVEFASLPHYGSLARVGEVGGTAIESMRAYWRALDETDAVWLMGPHPFSVVFAGIAAARRRRVFLGVRQDTAAYIGERYSGRRVLRIAGRLLEGCYRLLSRIFPVVVVGPKLARNYGAAPRLLSVAVSLVEPDDICTPEEAGGRDYGGDLTILCVSRLDPEKNPTLAVEILARLRSENPRWRLVFCGDGPLEGSVRERADELGLGDAVELCGYVPLEMGLRELYAESHFLLLTSWTEGLPQVALEAFAAGLPVVSTAVGGLAEAAPGAVTCYPPGDAVSGGASLEALAADAEMRRGQVDAGIAWVSNHTTAAEAGRIASFFRST